MTQLIAMPVIGKTVFAAQGGWTRLWPAGTPDEIDERSARMRTSTDDATKRRARQRDVTSVGSDAGTPAVPEPIRTGS